jgi:hypothetical protein
LFSTHAGQVAVEFLGMIPYLVLGLLAAMQLIFAVATVQATSGAARAGARALSQGLGDPVTAARRGVPAWVENKMTVQVGSGARPGVTVSSRIPILFPGLASGPAVTRRAWFDPEDGPAPWG